ncbi:MAG TPA: hypothetical protein ENJ95_15685 [Bacteroidetes bacterium]|nr:hypothetical protein [Bacteroidota bacterium]
MNKETLNLASRDGNYEKEFTSSFQSAIENMNSEDKDIYEKLLKIITEKIENGEMPKVAGNSMIRRLQYGEKEGRNGTETESLSILNDNYSSKFNPFILNNNYLSVFKVELNNRSLEVQEIYLKSFQITSGYELLYPLNMDYFEQNFENGSEQIKNAYRLNMPKVLRLAPNQRIIKYIAIPAIDAGNKKLQVQYIEGKSVETFNFQVHINNIDKTFQGTDYHVISATGHDPKYYDYFFVVSFGSGMTFSLSGNTIFINNEKKSIPMSVYGVAIKRRGEVYFGKNENINLSESLDTNIKVRFYEIRKK